MASVNYLGRIQLDEIHTQATNKTTALYFRPAVFLSFFFLLSFLILFLLLLLLLFSSPILSRRKLDVYHTSTHDVALQCEFRMHV